MRALGAYIFAGGFTVGVKRAGFDVTAHLEGSDYGVPTAKENWPELPIHYPEAEWPTGGPEVEALDFVYCNPPCAVFSPMGIVTTRGAESWRTDPRTSCWHNAFGFLERHRPRAWACESVPQAYSRGRPMIDDMTRRALEMGYSVTYLLLDAKWTGIPQSRRRFFLVCHRPSRLTGYQFNFAPPPTVGETLASVPEPGHRTITTSRSDWYDLVANTPPGDRVIHTWERLHPEETRELNKQGKVRGRPSFQDRRLKADEVMGAWVGDKFYHPTEARHLGVNEAKAICGYPPEFRIAKKDLRGFGSLLARAVMPPVGEWLGKAIAATLQHPDAEWTRRTVYRVDVREPGIAPVDLTSAYLTKDGKVIPAALAEAVGPVGDEMTACDEAEDEIAEADEVLETFVLADVAETPAVVGVTVTAVAKKEDTMPGRPFTLRPSEGDHWAIISTITGLDRELVKRVVLAMTYAASIAEESRHAHVGQIVGCERNDAWRIDAALKLIVAPEAKENGAPTGRVNEDLSSSSPAGKPSEPAARAQREPVIAGTEASSAGTSEPVLETHAERAPAPTEGRRGAEPKAHPSAPLDPSERPLDGEGSGAFIRRLLLLDRPEHTPERIVELVLSSFEGRKTTVKDVAWNWNKLASDGPTPPPWRGAKALKPNAYPGMNKTATAVTAAVVAEAVPASAKASTPPPPAASPHGRAPGVGMPAGSAARVAGPLERVAIVDWFPRVCGATDYARHLQAGFPGLELVSATRSGQVVKGWQTPWTWRCLKAGTAADALNGYDAVIMTDIACLSPSATEKDGLPFYAEVLSKVTVPMTAVFHGGMQYKKDYDPAINALFTAPGFTGSIVTVRDGQARERLKPQWPDVRLVVNPFLPYDPARAEGCRVIAKEKTKDVMMSARLASNKGQNALLAMMDQIAGDSHVWGENPYGLPSIGWRLHELGLALGYREDGPPKLRRDRLDLTHPNAPKFYTGEFAFTAPTGQRYAYHDGYTHLREVDWSPWLHLTLYAPNFGDLLEYTILDAVHAGALSIVPKSSRIDALGYSTFPTFEFEGSTLWTDDKTGDVKGKDFDRAGVAGFVNGFLAKPVGKLEELRAAQLGEVMVKHDAKQAWRSIEAAIRGEGSL